jgi:hypothetical protein
VLITEVVGGVLFSASAEKTYSSVGVVHFRVDMEVITKADGVHRSVMLELLLVVTCLDGPFRSVDRQVNPIDFFSSFD